MKRNAFFQIIHKNDGTYLKSYPAINGGEAITAEDIMLYLGKKKIQNVDIESVKRFIIRATKEKNAEEKFTADIIHPIKEYPVITVDRSGKLAKIRLYPPSNGGDRLNSRELLDLVGQAGLVHGIVQNNLELMLKGRLYCTDILLAKASLPVQGHDTIITYHFNVEKTCKPAISEDGSVDFHKLDMIESVSAGQLIASMVPADFGKPGMDVTGKEIAPIKVNNTVMHHGRNIHLSEDGLEMYSEVDGSVTLIEDTVFVSDQFEVPADVGPATGDIEYDGSILIKGNVLSGYTVKSSGDIIVNGAVEGAKLIAGGKIVLKRGMQGMGHGVMEAQGDIIANFIESATIRLGGTIVTDALMHSQIFAEGDIIVQGKRGLIVGGSVQSKTKIEAKNIGSTMGTATNLEVGCDPVTLEEYHRIEKETEQFAEEQETLQKNIHVLKKRMDANHGKLDEAKLLKLKSYTMRLKEINETLTQYSERYEYLNEEIQMQQDGKIIAHDYVYPGVKITISNSSKYIHAETQHCVFVREGADIRVQGI